MKQNQNTDKELMAKLKMGDLSALDIVFKKYSKQVYLYAFRVVKSSELSKEIVQQVFVILWNKKNKLKNYKSLKSFLFENTHNTVLKSIKDNDTIVLKKKQILISKNVTNLVLLGLFVLVSKGLTII